MIKFNTNNYVKVRLTEKGKSVLHDYANKGDQVLPNSSIKKDVLNRHAPDSENYSKFQMWQLINIFGSHCFNGNSNVFEDCSIYFYEADIAQVLRVEDAKHEF